MGEKERTSFMDVPYFILQYVLGILFILFFIRDFNLDIVLNIKIFFQRPINKFSEQDLKIKVNI